MQITKKFKFDAAHRLLNSYTRRCQNIHGHGYIVELTFSGNIKQDGMLVDFSYVSEHYKHVIDAFDHSFVVNAEDKSIIEVLPKITERFIIFPGNPTAENMAQYFYNYIYLDIKNLSVQEYFLFSVKVWETPTGCANANVVALDSDDNLPKLVLSTQLSYEWNLAASNKFQRNSIITYDHNLYESKSESPSSDLIG